MVAVAVLIKVVTLLGIGKGCKSEVWINFDTVEAEKFRKNLLCSMVVVICELDDWLEKICWKWRNQKG